MLSQSRTGRGQNTYHTRYRCVGVLTYTKYTKIVLQETCTLVSERQSIPTRPGPKTPISDEKNPRYLPNRNGSRKKHEMQGRNTRRKIRKTYDIISWSSRRSVFFFLLIPHVEVFTIVYTLRTGGEGAMDRHSLSAYK